ncbi:phosphoribosyl-AMP cyclohydrolase [Streptomyces thermocarboxydus]
MTASLRRAVTSGQWTAARGTCPARHNGFHDQHPRPSSLDPELAARLKRSPDGLLPAIAQQYDTGEVLMLGWMDDEALHRTLTTGRCTYWSRSRQEYWVKGDTSGHFQWVKSVALDCDADTVLVKVDQVGAACHTGDRTCFDADVLLKDAGTGVPADGQ